MGKTGKNNKGFTLGELVLVFGILMAVGAALAPLVRYNQIRLSRINCSNNLREIGLAMYIYARENGGNFPQSLSTLYEEQYLADRGIMDCPASKRVGTPEQPDYEYKPGLSVRSPSQDVLVGDDGGNHSGAGRNVLLVDGEVLWVRDR